MPVDLDEQVSLRTAYLIAYTFAESYWERGKRTDSLTDFVTDIGPVLEDQTVDPAQIGDWLHAAEEVLNRRSAYGSGECGTVDTLTNSVSAQPEPQTEVEYEAAFDRLMAEADSIHARMRRDQIGGDRDEIERLEAETQIIGAETRALLRSMGANL